MDFQDLLVEYDIFGWQNSDVHPNEVVLSFGGCYLCATFGKNRSRNATTRVQTDRRAVTETDPDRDKLYL